MRKSTFHFRLFSSKILSMSVVFEVKKMKFPYQVNIPSTEREGDTVKTTRKNWKEFVCVCVCVFVTSQKNIWWKNRLSTALNRFFRKRAPQGFLRSEITNMGSKQLAILLVSQKSMEIEYFIKELGRGFLSRTSRILCPFGSKCYWSVSNR